MGVLFFLSIQLDRCLIGIVVIIPICCEQRNRFLAFGVINVIDLLSLEPQEQEGANNNCGNEETNHNDNNVAWRIIVSPDCCMQGNSRRALVVG